VEHNLDTGAPVATVRERTTRPSQVITIIALAVPPLGILSAIGVLWGVAVHPLDIGLMVLLYTLTGLGITVGFHRLFTHRSFATTPVLRALWAILGSMAMQGPLTQWVTDHRKHHALSDREGDPHSPHAGHSDGVLGSLKGLVHAHVGWMFRTKGLERGLQYGKDLYADRMIRTVDRLYLLWVALTLGIPFGIGYLVGGSVSRGLQAMVWAGLLRIFLLQHSTFAVNSICHMFGRRTYPARDESRNNWVVALLTFGEGWHNNHHAFPSSAVHGLDRGQVDVAGLVIRGFAKAGLAWDVKRPDERQLARRRAQASGV
jgi:stearoyl-CoA desaturase (delta-9 desaturase)